MAPAACRAGSTRCWPPRAVRSASRPATPDRRGPTGREPHRLDHGSHPCQRPHSGAGPRCRPGMDRGRRQHLTTCPRTNSRSGTRPGPFRIAREAARRAPLDRRFGRASSWRTSRFRVGHVPLDLQRALPSGERRQLLRASICRPICARDAFDRVPAGIWKVRLDGDEIRDGALPRLDRTRRPVRYRTRRRRRLVRFPSFFSEPPTSIRTRSARSPAAHRVIAVANLDERRQRIDISSSQGPTRDDRSKPEIAAPGTDIVAANGFRRAGEPWVAMTAPAWRAPTSPGVVGLMLAANRNLTAAQCAGILQRTARPLPGGSYEWRNDAGFGAIDAAAARARGRDFQQPQRHQHKGCRHEDQDLPILARRLPAARKRRWKAHPVRRRNAECDGGVRRSRARPAATKRAEPSDRFGLYQPYRRRPHRWRAPAAARRGRVESLRSSRR